MSKRNVAYANPQQPAFITKLKQEIGYVDQTPTVDCKREALPTFNSSDESDGEDQPQVVVLNIGDLTKEEAAAVKEEATASDPRQRVLFRKPEKKSFEERPSAGQHLSRKRAAKEVSTSSKKNKLANNLLSFIGDEEEDDD